MEKKWSALAILTSVLILSIFLVFNQADALPEDLVCCANPLATSEGLSEFFCNDVQQFRVMDCCPEGSEYYDIFDSNVPDDYDDCIEKYIAPNCTSLPKCDVGCCYDVTKSNPSEVCTGTMEYDCESLDSSNVWQTGYDVDARLSSENPCYASSKDSNDAYNSIFSECPTKDECTEEYMTEIECQQSLTCVYCPDEGPTSNPGRCIAQCENCGTFTTDKDANGVCDSNTEYQTCADGYCGLATEDCMCGSEVILEDSFCCEVQSNSFSSLGSCTESCFPNCHYDQLIEVSKSRYVGLYTDCICGDDVVNLDSDGICCDFGSGNVTYFDGQTQCSVSGTVSGTIVDVESSQPLENVLVVIGSHTDSTDSSGGYSIDDILIGNHNVLTRLPNYQDLSTPVSIAYDGQHEIVDISMDPLISRCENPFAGEIDINLQEISCSDGAKELTLTWENPCPNNIWFFIIYRNDELIVPMWQNTTYTDTNYEWDTYVNYTIEPIYNHGGDTYTYSTENKYTGNEECIGYTATQICVDNNRYECGACNSKTALSDTCQSYETCVGPNNEGVTSCKSDEACQELGVPFGIFYDPATCYGTSNNNYCYYDYSLTSVDWCTDCSQDLTCFNYLSQEACEADNCLTFDQSGCVFDYTNQEFGKGICYESGYEGTDYCDICNGAFMNCDGQDCANLGSCYMFQESCESCANAQCSEYATEQDCIGGQNFDILPDSSCDAERTQIYSNDACGLNYCKWSSLTNTCFRDFNDDGIADREEGDYEAPTTTAILPEEYLGVGSEIIFNTTEQSFTYYCIDMDGACCPTTKADGFDFSQIKNIVLPGAIEESLRSQGWYTLKFYSVDPYNNSEEVKQVEFFGDVIAPNITDISFDITDSALDPLKSDMYISFTLSEYANCTDSLVPKINNLTEEVHVASGFNNKFQASYSLLYDSHYLYTVTCTDKAGNVGEEIFQVEVDRFEIIFEESPLNGLISRSTETLSLKTEFEATSGCFYSKADSQGRYLADYPFDPGTPTGTLDHHLYEEGLSSLSNGFYDYWITCTGDDWQDTTWLFFSVDTAAPNTELFSKPSNGAILDYSASTWYVNPTDFELVCTDEPQDSDGEIFGCGPTKWCECPGEECACTPNNIAKTFTVTEPTTFCFASTDLGGNAEDTTCLYVKTDNIPPTIPFVDDTGPVRQYPEYNYKTDTLRAKFNATDAESGINHYMVEIRSVYNDTILRWTDVDEADDWVFFDRDDESYWVRDEDGDKLYLENGTTYVFHVIAVDNAGNMGFVGMSNGITIDTTKVPNLCLDGLLSSGETDVDCGGITCEACNLTSDCYVNRDCESGFCSPINNTCELAACNDGYMNGQETDIDCGGNCFDKCGFGEGCVDDADCISNDCDLLTFTCVGADLSHCSNGVLDADMGETDIDCGGDCPGCGTGAQCTTGDDCDSGKCGPDGLCEIATCDDEIKNGDETDVDCGGSCSKCDIGDSCLVDRDCTSGDCEFSRCSGSNDEDEDEIPDSWEETYCENGDCDPDADDDRDGLSNLEEYLQGTDPQNADTDGDGHKDGKEVDKDTDPLDPDSRPKGSFWKWFLILLLIGLLGGGGYYYYQESQKNESAKKKPGTSMDSMFKSGAPASKAQPKKESKPLTRFEAETRSAEIARRRRLLKDKQRDNVFTAFDDKKKNKEDNKETKPVKKDLPKIESAPLKSELDKPVKPAKKKKVTGNVWDRLGSLNKEELKAYDKSNEQVHSKLASLYGKRLDGSDSKKLSSLVSRDKITKSNIVNVFTELSKTNNLSKGVLKKILSRMVVGKKITQAEAKNILEHLAENKAIKKSEILDILSYIDSKKKNSQKK